MADTKRKQNLNKKKKEKTSSESSAACEGEVWKPSTQEKGETARRMSTGRTHEEAFVIFDARLNREGGQGRRHK